MGAPTRWSVELHDGTTIEIWADSFDRDGDYYTFGSLFDLDEGEALSQDALVLGETPSNPRRFVLATARIPKVAVLLPTGDPEWPAIEG